RLDPIDAVLDVGDLLAPCRDPVVLEVDPAHALPLRADALPEPDAVDLAAREAGQLDLERPNLAPGQERHHEQGQRGHQAAQGPATHESLRSSRIRSTRPPAWPPRRPTPPAGRPRIPDPPCVPGSRSEGNRHGGV